MDKIDLKELSGYQEDKKGLSDFQRPYLIPSLIGFATAIAGFILIIAEMDAGHYYRGAKVTFLDGIWFHFEKITTTARISSGLQGYLPVALFAGGLAMLFATMFCMQQATPISGISKQKMEKYWNANPDPGAREIIYVDRASRTYFRRVFARVSRGANTPPIPF